VFSYSQFFVSGRESPSSTHHNEHCKPRIRLTEDCEVPTPPADVSSPQPECRDDIIAYALP
jgi:hypothetical protein